MTWEPRIVAFACNWCSYAGADTAGVSRMAHPANFRIVRVMCSGRIQPAFVLRAFEQGADGVLVSGCHLGDCHYMFGNERALEMFERTRAVVKALGIEPGRLRLEWVSAAEGQRWADLIGEFTEQVRALGPSPVGPAATAATPPDPGAVRAAATRTRALLCQDCGKCTAVCPVVRAGAATSPRRRVLHAAAGDSDALDADLATCHTCGLCEARCPMGVQFTALVRDLREVRARAGAEPDCPHGGALRSMMRIQARGGFSGNRLDWIPAEARTSPVEGQVFLFAGCAAHLDALFPDPGPRAGAAAASAVRVLNALGVVPVVSPEERCCGHDLLFAGDRTSFEALAAHNAGLVTRSGAWTVVAPCAECARALRLDMAAWLPARVRVLHFAEYLAERVGELQLRAVEARTVAFHDPCRLCRHLGVVDAPRAVLDAIPGLRRVELPRHGARAACCAGAAWGHCDRHAKAVQVERLDEATTAGAEVLVTACPKCRVHLACATEGAADRPHPDLVDLADLLAGSLPLSP